MLPVVPNTGEKALRTLPPELVPKHEPVDVSKEQMLLCPLLLVKIPATSVLYVLGFELATKPFTFDAKVLTK